MMKPAMFLESAVREKSQRITRAFTRLGFGYPAVFRSDAKRGQAKASRRDARNVAMILIEFRAIHAGAIGYQTCLRIRLFPKIIEGTVL